MQQKISRAQLIGRYHQKPLDQMPEQFIQFVHQYPQAFKIQSLHPLQPRPLRGFNQEILVYSSNCATPLKTAGIQQCGDMFKFDEQQILTPQPKQTNTFDWSQQQVQAAKREPIFSQSIAGLTHHLINKQWYYVDDYQRVQGPFSSIQMDAWYLKGYFDDILRVGFKPEQSESFIRIFNLKTQKKTRQMLKFLRAKSCTSIITTIPDQIQQKQIEIQDEDKQIIDQTPALKMPPIIKKKK